MTTLSGEEPDYPDPQNWFTGNFACGAGNNTYGYCNPEFDRLAATGDRSADPAQRMGAYAQAHGVLVHDLRVIPLFYRGQVAAYEAHTSTRQEASARVAQRFRAWATIFERAHPVISPTDPSRLSPLG